MAALDWDGSALQLAKLRCLAEPEGILRWVKAEAAGDAVIGIDAPLVIPNATGMRDAERQATCLYGKYHAGAYPSNQARVFWKRTTEFSEALGNLGFGHGDELTPKTPGRFQIEGYPPAAIVQLFALDQIVKYKKGKLAARSAELRRLRGLMLDRLPRLVPALSLAVLPEVPSGGKELKAVEDQLDAVLAAYVAAHWWYWGRERDDVLGDAKRGYIIVPHRSEPVAQNEPIPDPDPLVQFQKWFDQAQAAGIPEANAMTLATTSADGQPSARMLLLKDLSDDGFVFFTNFQSRKGRELAANPRAALVFYWPTLHRQVRVTGEVSKASRAEAEAYFATRPRGAQLAACASSQSSVIPDRAVLEAGMEELAAKYADQPIPTPPTWGGYRLRPTTIEFWQGSENRLHDRLRYDRSPGGVWKIARLAP